MKRKPAKQPRKPNPNIVSGKFACPVHKKAMILYSRGVDISADGQQFQPWECWICPHEKCGRYVMEPEGCGPKY